MATSSIMKFSLLIVAVFLSSYVCYTEAVSRCPLSPTATPTEMIDCYNCTSQNCNNAYNACSGSNCSLAQPVRNYMLNQLYIAVSVFVTTSCTTSCSPSVYAVIDAVVTLLALVFTLLLNIVATVGISLAVAISIIGLITAQANICISLLTSIGTTVALSLRAAIIVFCNLAITVCLSLVI